jgi:VWFA-related protein
MGKMASWFVLWLVLDVAGLGSECAAGRERADHSHATVNEVALDLVVRDKKGRLVKNLKPGDVEIYEDGVRQEIRSLRLAGGEAPAQHAAEPSGGAQPEPEGEAHPPPMPLRSLNLICIVFHNLDSGTRKWAVAAAQDFVKTQLRPGTWVGVFNLDSRLTPLQAFTMNRNEVLRAAANAFNGTRVDITRDRGGGAELHAQRERGS